MKLNRKILGMMLSGMVVSGLVFFFLTAILLQRYQRRNYQIFRNELLESGAEQARVSAELFLSRLIERFTAHPALATIEGAVASAQRAEVFTILLKRGGTHELPGKSLLTPELLEVYFGNADRNHVYRFSRNNFREFFEDQTLSVAPVIIYYHLFRVKGEWFMVGYGRSNSGLLARLRFVEGRNRLDLAWLLLTSATVMSLGVLLVAYFMAVLLRRSILRPIDVLQGAFEDIAAGRLDRRVDVWRIDEIGALESSFNEMAAHLQREIADHKKTQAELQLLASHLEEEITQKAEGLRQAEASAESANAAKTRFLANTSHELRTPLNAILGFARLLGKTPLSSEQEQFVGMICKSGEILLDHVLSMLDVVQFDGEPCSVESEFDLQQTLEQVMGMMGNGAWSGSTELLLHYSPRLPRCFKGDYTRLRQALAYALGYALKCGSQGGVRLRVSLVCSSLVAPRSRDIIQFSIMHVGGQRRPAGRTEWRNVEEAMPEEETTLDEPALYIAQRLVSSMRGGLWLQAGLGQGANMRIRLPLAATEDYPSAKSPVEQRAKGKRVWLIDPSAELRKMVFRWGRIYGFSLIGGEAGFSTCRAVRGYLKGGEVKEKPDVVLVNPRLSDGSGIDLMGELKKREGWVEARYVGLCNSLVVAGGERRNGVGFDAYCPKPVFLDQILVALQAGAPSSRACEPAPDGKRAVRESLLDISAGGEVPRLARGEGIEGRPLILVAEDNVPSQMLMRVLLEEEGCVCEVVGDGQEAVDFVRKRPPDLILMDIMMPKLNGVEATLRIREMPAGHMPIVALTAAAAELRFPEFKAVGMNDILTKPVSQKAVSQLLHRWLNAPR